MKRFIVVIALMVALLGCGGEAVPTPEPTPTPQDWLTRAVQAWNNTESFHYILTLVGRTITLDSSGLFAFDRVEGDVVAPDRMQAETEIRTPFGTAQIGYITIGDQQWLTSPLTGRWEQAPPDMQTEVSGIFNPESGIGAFLADLQNLQQLPNETLDGTDFVRLRGTLPGALLSDFAADLPETVQVDLWVSPADSRIHQIILTETGSAIEPPPTWTFRLSNFNGAPAIEPPL
jgi:lipoprotein LprG